MLLPQMSLLPVAYNREALEILAFPRSPEDLVRSSAALARHIGARLVSRSAKGARTFVAEFQSGNRTYHCRTLNFCFDGKEDDGPGRTTTLILLERTASPSRLLKRQACEKFGLTPRERQMVELLIEGMTTKEMAQVLCLSPNTIKSFLRLVMAKMGVSTRSGIVGKLLESNHS
jgi:DNA-binding CsgD family transcriptional regulator